jgi:hypothetical protein
VLYEQGVEGNPVRRVDDFAQCGLGSLRAPGSDDAQAVRDAVHVRVDGDRGDAVPEHEHAVRGLRAHAGEGHQGLVGARDLPPEPLEDLPGARPDHPGLDPVEPGRADQGFEGGRRGPGERRGVRVPGEQALARRVGVRVPRALGEDRSDEHLERILGVVAQIGPAPVAGPVQGGQAVEDLLPFGRADTGRSAHAPVLARSPDGRGSAAEAAARASAGSRPGSERSGSSSPSPRTSSPMR